MRARQDQYAAARRGAATLRQRFTAKGKPLKRVQLFKYLGRIIAYDGNDVPAARPQLARARAVWGRLSKIIAKESAPAPVAGMFYQTIVVVVLLYECESWVLPPSQLRALEGFHAECARRLAGMRPRKVKGKWVYPKSLFISSYVLSEVWLREVFSALDIAQLHLPTAHRGEQSAWSEVLCSTHRRTVQCGKVCAGILGLFL